jgi:hypothetical protein
MPDKEKAVKESLDGEGGVITVREDDQQVFFLLRDARVMVLHKLSAGFPSDESFRLEEEVIEAILASNVYLLAGKIVSRTEDPDYVSIAGI